MYALWGTRDNSARIVPLATREIQRDWGLLAPVFLVTAKGAAPAIQTQVSETWTRCLGAEPAEWLSHGGESWGRNTTPEITQEMGKEWGAGTEVKGDRRGDSTLDRFCYGNATGL